MRTETSNVANYAVAQQNCLRERHYVLNSPKHPKRWAGFVMRQVDLFRARFVDDFCLVIVGDPAIPGDFYAIPWADASTHFVQDSVYPLLLKNGKTSLRWQVHLADIPHVFQFELARTDLRSRPQFDATKWYGNYEALGVPEQRIVDVQLVELVAGGATFPEGRMVAAMHYRRERNPQLVRKAKARFLRIHGRLYCEVCTFDFKGFYGDLGEGFVEAHHSVPLRSLTEEAKTRVEDLRMVCANCHRMLHKGKQWLTIAELSDVVSLANKAR
jgi:hypothetical protein